MKQNPRFLFLFIALLPLLTFGQRQEIELFDLWYFDDEGKAFVSLSDIYYLSDNEDSMAIPDVNYDSIVNREYFVIDSNFRDRFFNETYVSKTDSLFIYGYASNSLLRFALSELPLVARMSAYGPYDEYAIE